MVYSEENYKFELGVKGLTNLLCLLVASVHSSFAPLREPGGVPIALHCGSVISIWPEKLQKSVDFDRTSRLSEAVPFFSP